MARRDDGRVPGLHRWLWMDYVARDPAGALDFYGSAVGFRNEVHERIENGETRTGSGSGAVDSELERLSSGRQPAG